MVSDFSVRVVTDLSVPMVTDLGSRMVTGLCFRTVTGLAAAWSQLLVFTWSPPELSIFVTPLRVHFTFDEGEDDHLQFTRRPLASTLNQTVGECTALHHC
jgi:hypothetical protein